MRFRLILGLVLLVLEFSADAACPSCGPGDGWVPEILRENQAGELELLLREWGGSYDLATLTETADGWVFSEADSHSYRPRVEEQESALHACGEGVPHEPLAQEEAIRLRPHLRVGHSAEETIEACDRRNGYVSFGLGFYEGEGADGVGGIGRFDPATGDLEVRRPAWLRDKSTRHMIDDGRHIWFTALQYYEDGERSWGLHRYRWADRTLDRLGGTPWSPCGSTVRDLFLTDDRLVVATDFGLSILDLNRQQWNHLALRGRTLAPEECNTQLSRLLEAMAAGKCPVCSPHQTFEELVRVQPSRLRTILFNSPELRGPQTLVTIASLSRNFEEFEDLVWEEIPPDADDWVRRRVAEAFAATGDRSERWREAALELAKQTGDWKIVGRFRGDEIVLGALLREARREPETWNDRSSRDRAIEAVPWAGGERSIPLLIGLLEEAFESEDRGESIDDREFHFASIIVSLERAAHRRIEPDGTVVTLASNSDRYEYAEEEYGAFRRWNNSIDELRQIGGRWLSWWNDRGRMEQW